MAYEVFIRFYEELNDFIPKRFRGNTNRHRLTIRGNVRDLVESFGVPHTEVDLVLVNGEPVDFEHRISQGDRVSVYPVFETLDITGVTKLRAAPLRSTRFILDVHLGKLARLLRMYGFDTHYENDCSDERIITLATEQQRIILTRDIGILKNKKVTHGYFVRSQDPAVQIQEVIHRFDLQGRIDPLSRCMVCNGKITEVEMGEVRHLLKPKTRAFYKQFYRCTSCGKVYWEGSHYQRMMRHFLEERGGPGTDQSPSVH